MTNTDRAALGLVGIARRAGRAAVGADAIRSAANKRPVYAIVAARDASSNALARIGQLAWEVPSVRVGTREELGQAVGRGVAALVGVTDRELAARIVELSETDGTEQEHTRD